MAAYVQHNNSRRATVLVVIIAFHLLLLYGLVTGLARKVVEVVAAPLVTDLIEEVQQEDAPPPPPPPQMERPPVEVPPPEVSIDIPMDTATTTAISDVTDRPVPVAPPPPPPPAPVNRVAPKLDVKRSPPTDDFYPPSARRAEIEGVTTVRACVSPDGRTSGEATVSKSSGNTSLDEAATKWAKRARWSAGTEDGKPVEMCSQFNVRFKLTD
ncbi:MAG: energy transducer TonB [Alphaproteobacteria bacterium]|nr:energy transducer TonB [Alphaproteobacteria bacterium]